MLELRGYQKEANKKLVNSIANGNKLILYSMATGGGKTACFSDFAMKVASLGYKTLIVVDRIELLKQTRQWGTKEVPFGSLTSNLFAPENVTVAMLQTLRARLKYESYQAWFEQFDFIFLDEVHQYCNGSSFQRICDLSNDDCPIIGVSATVWDQRGYLLNGFDDLVDGADIRLLIELGYLVKPNHLTTDLFDFSNVKVTSTGDYDSGAIDDIVVNTDKMDRVFELWYENARSKKTLAFCSTVVSAESYTQFFRMNGVMAKCVSAKNSDVEREQILIDYRENKIDILFNVGLYVAGFDEPTIECVMLLNPTKILRRYIQCAGRGLRLCPEIQKTECLFLDFVGNSFRHLEVDAIRSYIKAPDRAKEEAFDEIECPACGFVFNIDENECPECGFKLNFDDEESNGARKVKNKRDFERLIKLKSVQKELHDVIYQFVDRYCLVKTEETGNIANGRVIKKWCYGYRDNGSPVFKSDKDYSAIKYPYPVITKAKKTNCWYVFHTICVNYDPRLGALRYYGQKLRKAKRFLDQIKNKGNKAFVNMYKLM